jgi:hypothetical protein
MLGVFQHIPELFENHKPKLTYKAGDINKSVILMWKAIQRGWKPPTKITKERFDELKYDTRSSAEKGLKLLVLFKEKIEMNLFFLFLI